MTKTLTKTKTYRARPQLDDAPKIMAAPVNVITTRRGFHTCAQPIAPIQIGTPIMPEGFVTDTGLLPSE